MGNGIYTALSGSIAMQHQLDSISHNLSNVNTAGYRSQRLTFTDFSIDPASEHRQVGIGQTVSDMSAGVLEETGNPLDLALSGEGFFTVGTARDMRLTRDGSFRLSPEGDLVTQSGQNVLDTGGEPINLQGAADSLLVAADGTIWNEFGPLAQVSVVTVDNESALQPVGDGDFRTGRGNINTTETVDVVQGYSEGSNVNAVQAMTQMIMLHRHFEAMQQLIQQHADLDQRVINSVGRIRA